MLTELLGKGGCLCQPAKLGRLRCPLIVRPTSEDVITGHIFHTLQIVNPRWWLPQMLNEALGTRRFRQQVFRELRVELWKNKPAYPRELLPWDEGSTQVDATITWENPPTTVFIEAKYLSNLAPKAIRDDGRSGYPSDQLVRNVRVGLLEAGYFQHDRLFETPARDFVLLVLSPSADHGLVTVYRDTNRLRQAIPFSYLIPTLPMSPFIGQLSYAALIRLLSAEQQWMSRPEQLLTTNLIEYLKLKFDRISRNERQEQHSFEFATRRNEPSDRIHCTASCDEYPRRGQ